MLSWGHSCSQETRCGARKQLDIHFTKSLKKILLVIEGVSCGVEHLHQLLLSGTIGSILGFLLCCVLSFDERFALLQAQWLLWIIIDSVLRHVYKNVSSTNVHSRVLTPHIFSRQLLLTRVMHSRCTSDGLLEGRWPTQNFVVSTSMQKSFVASYS